MKRIVPIKNTVLCKKIENTDEHTGNILFKRKAVDEYVIVDFSCDGEFPFKIGDTVVVSSNGDEVKCESEKYFIFKTQNVVAKIDNN